MASAGTVRLYAAGSLKAALTEVAGAFEATNAGSARIEAEFAASGLANVSLSDAELDTLIAWSKGHAPSAPGPEPRR